VASDLPILVDELERLIRMESNENGAGTPPPSDGRERDEK
jgi:hypothetical protein